VKKNKVERFARVGEKRKLNAQIKDERRRIFLEEYARFGTKTTAAKIAGLSRTTIENWENEDPEFAALLKEAQPRDGGTVGEMRRRAGDHGRE
jgi:DNA invertase Pin-like site-specific DNA recombinase